MNYNEKIRNLLCILTLFWIISCSNKSDEVSHSYSSGFNNLIHQSKAKEFDYQYDGLSPQTSYLVGCKLKFLEIETHGELTDNKQQVIFENDSISKIYRLTEIYAENNNEAGRNLNKKNDSLFIIDFKKGNVKAFFNGNLVYDKKIDDKLKESKQYIYKVKKFTEMEYNCGKSK